MMSLVLHVETEISNPVEGATLKSIEMTDMRDLGIEAPSEEEQAKAPDDIDEQSETIQEVQSVETNEKNAVAKEKEAISFSPSHIAAPKQETGRLPTAAATGIGRPTEAPPSTRRTIFGRYWEKSETDSQTSSHSHGSEQRAHLRTRSWTDDRIEDGIDLRYFSPPPERQKGLKKHHSLIEQVPDDVRLQELPTPLRRYLSDGPPSGGMYPLLSPCSILRKRSIDETPSQSDNEKEARPEKGVDEIRDADEDLPQQLRQMKWAEMTSTTTVRPPSSKLNRFERVDLNDSKAMDSDLFRPMEISNNQNDEKSRKVQFDPRIVITEFDEELEREWFSEGELNSFKAETVYLAQQYMLEHPVMAEEFTRSEIDPITGKERKRALFSLPFLSALSDDSSAIGNITRVDRNKLARSEIRKILVADPNKMILQLFCKSLKQIFPQAEFAVAQSGEDALGLYEAALGANGTHGHIDGGGFDVVIADEKLHRAVSIGNEIMSGQLKNVEGIHARSVSTTALIPDKDGPGKPASLSNLQSLSNPAKRGSGRRRGMSGSELLKRICGLEDERQGGGPEVSLVKSEAASLQTTVQRKPLLVGVSVDLARDEKSLQDSGADMVWSKPPPKMNETLRNQMLSALITKRQQSGLCVRLPTDKQDT